jgi:hypothetical protein
MKRNWRNNNPLNIKRSGIEWAGLATPSEMTPAQRAETVFCVFRTPEYGVRAAALNLQTYLRRGQDTVAEIVGAWAPAAADGNHTQSYIGFVAGKLDAAPDRALDTSDPDVLLPLIKAMATFEAGEDPPWGDQVFRDGIERALAPRAPKSPGAETVKGQARHGLTFASGAAAAVAVGLIGQGDADQLTAAADQLFSAENLSAFSAAVAILSGLVGTIWSHISKKGS